MDDDVPLKGGCDCGLIRYEVTCKPMFVHCCHCRWCQRESGSAFAVNAIVESNHVVLTGGEPEAVDTPSESGNGQIFLRCPECRIAVWSYYATAGDMISFVRVGTLDAPDLVPPDIHIFTRSKQPWVLLPEGIPAVDVYYDRNNFWPEESLQRRQALIDTRR